MKKTPKQFAIALYEAAAGKKGKVLEGVIFNFVKILQKENKLKWQDKIIAALEKHARQEQGIEEIEIQSARPLSQTFIAEIKENMKELNPELKKTKRILINEKQMPELLGGLTIKSGDQIWDFSFKKQLKSLKNKLISA